MSKTEWSDYYCFAVIERRRTDAEGRRNTKYIIVLLSLKYAYQRKGAQLLWGFEGVELLSNVFIALKRV